jgi:hypothetical protein
MKALAFANNDIAVIAWTLDKKLDDCLGFAVYRIGVHASKETALPAMARFEATAADAQATTEQAPVQKFCGRTSTPRAKRSTATRSSPWAGSPARSNRSKASPRSSPTTSC